MNYVLHSLAKYYDILRTIVLLSSYSVPRKCPHELNRDDAANFLQKKDKTKVISRVRRANV